MKTIIWFGFGNSAFTEVGQRIVLICGAKKVQHRLEWSYGDQLIYRIDERSGHNSKGGSRFTQKAKMNGKDLRIDNVEKRDAGKFTCKADGVSYEQTLIVVSVSVAPSHNVQVGTQATLECQVTDQTSTVEWKKPDGSVEKSKTVQLNPVDASHGGMWQCHVVNGVDKFNKTLTVTVTGLATTPFPKPPIPKQPDIEDTTSTHSKNSSGGTNNPHTYASEFELLGLIWWVCVAIGVGSLLVIILIVVIIVMVKRIRRKKRKLKMKKAKQSQKAKTYCECERQTAAPKPQQGRRREKPPALALQPLLKE
ncbi:CD4-2 molecule, tandem duplicate 2 isoform X2 [Kryptolebias marmoratus]|uniref:CD4-2 molecule, tandem duplicate 2 isoform X2 n=1 Tax=Kryptolebias marmoratus TaxID=37003 RepID=UPI000D5305FE|nr:CD4-2 molecule, tandem duplicate 2 isoform X2 [Kryptolebias marmoratus]XP_037836462.1 CD4-2 molecule, tandem duplicate 2 isoform X2 [Kryptolebias marmoratus]